MANQSKLIASSKRIGSWKFGQCYYNATYNKYNAFKHIKGLKVVYGSLGLNGHFEYGGKNHTVMDYYKNPYDSHAWLEDADGNVYDYIYNRYGEVAEYWGKEVTFPLDYEILGVPKSELLEDGLEYIAAPIKAQRDILDNVKVAYAQRFRDGVLPRIKFDKV